MAFLAEAMREAREAAARRGQERPLDAILAATRVMPPTRGFAAALRDASPRHSATRHGLPAVIAEIKFRSPSRGELRASRDVERVADGYARAGAVALSVLVDALRFDGHPAFLGRASSACPLPLLAKGFFADPYQIVEMRLAGADAVLLITAGLTPDELRALHATATDLGMDVLVEVHSEDDLARLAGLAPSMIGVNHRDLATLQLDMGTTASLAPRLPAGAVRVAESGLGSREDLLRMASLGYDAVLIGSNLMSAEDPGAALASLLRASRPTPIKVCGLTRIDDACLAWELGAAALGFVFHPASPRALDPDDAAALRRRLPEDAYCVGVFVDRPPAEVAAIAERVGLDAVQLHGNESAADCAAIGLPVIKALRPAPGEIFSLPPDDHPAAAFLLDAWHPDLAGGTGRRADWNLARRLAARCRLILAGGIGPENAAAAIAAVGPAALDVSSGVEREPGIKDPALLHALLANADPKERPCLLP